ncbi:hypothetical protein GcM3_018036 [Golovinomyces cichoracearum]|uniref:Uncharacterized protein n=1 Tax=Golovinomyces cichoracearum TaxID=62708 RepID=A0A420J874_9PEZI|nr:hypothetical protein GcM3_018036 [Golovinomyces cichoracearum]
MPLASPIVNKPEFNGDLVAVRGEVPWFRESSVSRMNPDIDISSLLTQIDAPHNLDSTKEMEQKTSSPHAAPDITSSQLEPPTASSRARLRHLSVGTMEERLAMIPEKRALPWREWVEPSAENETGGESRRKQIRFGCLLATRGDVQTIPCNSCANGRGKFSVCVSLPNFFKGACASCQLSGRPNRCSIKKNDGSLGSPNSTRISGTLKADFSSKSGLQLTENDSPHVKRRKINTPMTKTASKTPELENTRTYLDQKTGDMAPQQVNIGQRHWATVNPQAAPKSTQFMTKELTHNGNVTHSDLNQVNTPGKSLGNRPSITSNFTGEDNNCFAFQSNRIIRKDTSPREEGGTFIIIDTLPKGKQRQVYSLISGIQGGINHLQRELNLLKNALGINDDD